jgi:hypothetical protein
MSLEGKTMVVSDGAADLFEDCRRIIGAVNGGHPCNAETMIIICTRFLETAGVPWTER